jgi:hypothetical protein
MLKSFSMMDLGRFGDMTYMSSAMSRLQAGNLQGAFDVHKKKFKVFEQLVRDPKATIQQKRDALESVASDIRTESEKQRRRERGQDFFTSQLRNFCSFLEFSYLYYHNLNDFGNFTNFIFFPIFYNLANILYYTHNVVGFFVELYIGIHTHYRDRIGSMNYASILCAVAYAEQELEKLQKREIVETRLNETFDIIEWINEKHLFAGAYKGNLHESKK